MTDGYRYLSEEELEAMIAQVEEKELIASPVYLKDMIMARVQEPISERPDNPEEWNAVPCKANALNYREKKAAANRQLILYSVKIISAAAVAVFCLTAVPVNFSGGYMPLKERGRIERQIEKDLERYKQEEEQFLKQSISGKSDLEQFISDKSEEIFGIFNKNN